MSYQQIVTHLASITAGEKIKIPVSGPEQAETIRIALVKRWAKYRDDFGTFGSQLPQSLKMDKSKLDAGYVLVEVGVKRNSTPIAFSILKVDGTEQSPEQADSEGEEQDDEANT